MSHVLPELTTDRLVLRIAGPRYLDRIIQYYADNRDHFARWDAPAPDNYLTEDFWGPRLEDNVTSWRIGESCRFALFLRDDPQGPIIGNCAITNIVRKALQTGIIGYAIDHRFEGRGMMTEAVRAVVDFGFGPLNLHRIEAGYHPANVRSGRVLRRLDFEPYGYARDYLRVGSSGWEDHVLVHRINHDWNPDADEGSGYAAGPTGEAP